MFARKSTFRARIGREIHDGLGHHLTAISILLARSTAFRGIDPIQADDAVEDAREAARLALADVRRSVRTLSEDEPFDLCEALMALARGLPVRMQIRGDLARYDDARRLVVYRTAQEALTNALRHATASRIDVDVHVGHNEALITVTDDGSGFDTESLGWGLHAMRERVEGVGGFLRIASRRGAGTTVAASVPRVTG